LRPLLLSASKTTVRAETSPEMVAGCAGVANADGIVNTGSGKSGRATRRLTWRRHQGQGKRLYGQQANQQGGVSRTKAFSDAGTVRDCLEGRNDVANGESISKAELVDKKTVYT